MSAASLWPSTLDEPAPPSVSIYVTNWQRNVSLQEKKSPKGLIPLQALEVSNYCKQLALPQILTPHSAPHSISPRHNTCASTALLSHFHSVLLIFLGNFQTTDFSYSHVVSLTVILNTTVITQLPALPSDWFPFEASRSVCKFQHTTHAPTSFNLQFPSRGKHLLIQQQLLCNHFLLPFLFPGCLPSMLPSHQIFLHWHLSPQSLTNFNHLVPTAFEWTIQVFVSVRRGITNMKEDLYFQSCAQTKPYAPSHCRQKVTTAEVLSFA